VLEGGKGSLQQSFVIDFGQAFIQVKRH